LKALFGAERCFERQNGTQMDFKQPEATDASVAEEVRGRLHDRTSAIYRSGSFKRRRKAQPRSGPMHWR
jgi:muconolactone delta-isomerase